MEWWSGWRGLLGGSIAKNSAREFSEALDKEARSKMDDSFAESCLEQKWDEAAAKLAAGATGRGEAWRHSALFWIAAGNGPLDLAKAIIPTMDADFKERGGQSPLMAAASRGSLAMAELALGLSRVDKEDLRNCDALLYAVAGGHPEMVNLLIAAGAEPTEGCLRVAIFSGDLKTARALLAGAPDTLRATLPLAEAAVRGMTCEVKPAQDADGRRSVVEFESSARLALADPDIPVIRRRGSLEILRFAMSFDQGPLTTRGEITALMVAAEAGEAEAVKELVAFGGLHAQSACGAFALGLAASHGSEACVRILLEASDASLLAEQQMASAVVSAALDGQLSCTRIIWEAMPPRARQEVREAVLEISARWRHPEGSQREQDWASLTMMVADGASPLEIAKALVGAIKAGNLALADALFPLSDSNSNARAALEDLARSSTSAEKMSALVAERAHSMMEAEELERASGVNAKDSRKPATACRL